MAEIVRLKPARKCPICGKPATQANYPFCSPRCQDIDLNRWLSDSYRVPTDEAPAAPSKTDEEE
ncbi:MAG TPA: DNA gyrase inhibitor YacG [Devosia sp.]|jgi:endogenous inhibitor of DNA gyrase (YacG/DUF329 family)|nr:DNA gyrase inhibitor YacG [Devosia sp.]